MKIVMVNSTLSGGAATACKRLIHALQNRFAEIKLLSVNEFKQNNNNNFLIELYSRILIFLSFVYERLSFIRIAKAKKFRFAFSIANSGLKISTHPFITEANLIHLHWINHGFISLKGFNILIELGKPIVWTLHDMWAFTGGCHYSNECDHYLLKCGDCMMLKNPRSNDLSNSLWEQKKSIFHNKQQQITFIACSDWMLKKAKASSLIKNFNIVHIPNAININVFKPLDKQVSRNKIGISTGKKVILFGAANIHDYRKGFSILVEAIQICNKYNPDAANTIDFAVFGKSKLDLTAYFSPFKVHQLGTISNERTMVTVYNACDFYITPSLEDNLPNTVMESLACGKPVIAFKVGGIPEMVSQLENGYLAEEQSPAGLADAINKAINCGENYYDLTVSARNKVIQNYSEEVVAKQHIALYNKIMHKALN